MGEIYKSKLPPKAYMAALRSCFSFPLALFYTERVTGITIGRFFSVAYHSPFEWNRRITGECNRAIGYVKGIGGKTEIHFIRSRGMLSAFWLVFWTLICALFSNISMDEISLFGWFVCFAISVGICCVTAFQDSLTDAGQEGAGIITALLEKPDEFYYC